MEFPVELVKHSLKLRDKIKDLKAHNEYLAETNEWYARQNSDLRLALERVNGTSEGVDELYGFTSQNRQPGV